MLQYFSPSQLPPFLALAQGTVTERTKPLGDEQNSLLITVQPKSRTSFASNSPASFNPGTSPTNVLGTGQHTSTNKDSGTFDISIATQLSLHRIVLTRLVHQLAHKVHVRNTNLFSLRAEAPDFSDYPHRPATQLRISEKFTQQIPTKDLITFLALSSNSIVGTTIWRAVSTSTLSSCDHRTSPNTTYYSHSHLSPIVRSLPASSTNYFVQDDSSYRLMLPRKTKLQGAALLCAVTNFELENKHTSTPAQGTDNKQCVFTRPPSPPRGTEAHHY